MTELSEYTAREGSEEHMAMLERRVHPRLPRKRLLCFYPMSKKREGADNWYSLDYDERRRLMGGHGKLGAKFSGRVIQLITGATGLSDWEWGVTLLSDDPKDIKDIVYEMRFDEVSARYGIFGPFTVGLVAAVARGAGDRPPRRGRIARSEAKCLHFGTLLLVHIGVWRGLAGPDPRWRRMTPTWRERSTPVDKPKNVRTWRTPCSARRVVPTRVSSANHHG